LFEGSPVVLSWPVEPVSEFRPPCCAAEAALSQARVEVTDLPQQVVALAAQPRGLFPRRRSAAVATA